MIVFWEKVVEHAVVLIASDYYVALVPVHCVVSNCSFFSSRTLNMLVPRLANMNASGI